MEFEFKSKYDVNDLLTIMDILRGEDGCPWDKEQTHSSIRKNFIEEVYEVCEAIDMNNIALLQEELGDVLLQVVFHCRMEKELGNFDFDDVADGICKKLIIRHPHIFTENGNCKTSSEVLVNWENIKNSQKGMKSRTESMKDVPRVLPGLMRAQKVQARAAKSGFDYPNIQYAFSDLVSELSELMRAVSDNDQAAASEELGDLIFSCVNLSRFLTLDAEEALTASTDKFICRFSQVEALADAERIDLNHADICELDRLWKKAKDLSKAQNT
ncbi:nucleoside triphosphate pyrophosphohydrolase [Acetanaerobacterium elongatum]|uniref:Tetrapyrrole methylase family protein / MazG family protein n=1 Tax=Acetanaerobacterium elongatum TaxID=258515 RepID=A0A1H0A7B6_9FIRM|nr:nucleoside triphosphate pyrophosphohydrolase [Acetanaerobacterium elongatum]SDN29518.1 tetrapyrrole methylase family protein / MazG family protein [Acetanaerobacterium elongatum]